MKLVEIDLKCEIKKLIYTHVYAGGFEPPIVGLWYQELTVYTIRWLIIPIWLLLKWLSIAIPGKAVYCRTEPLHNKSKIIFNSIHPIVCIPIDFVLDVKYYHYLNTNSKEIGRNVIDMWTF